MRLAILLDFARKRTPTGPIVKGGLNEKAGRWCCYHHAMEIVKWPEVPGEQSHAACNHITRDGIDVERAIAASSACVRGQCAIFNQLHRVLLSAMPQGRLRGVDVNPR